MDPKTLFQLFRPLYYLLIACTLHSHGRGTAVAVLAMLTLDARGPSKTWLPSAQLHPQALQTDMLNLSRQVPHPTAQIPHSKPYTQNPQPMPSALDPDIRETHQKQKVLSSEAHPTHHRSANPKPKTLKLLPLFKPKISKPHLPF